MDKKIDVKFISLFKQNNSISFESKAELAELTHNAIMEEFNILYDREQRLFYELD